MRRFNLTYMTLIPMLAVIFLLSGCYTQVGTIMEERPAAREEVYVEEYYDDTGTTYRYYSDDYYYDDYSYRSPRHRMFFNYYYPTHYSFGWGVQYDPFWYDRYYVWDPWYSTWYYPRYSFNIYFGWPSWRYSHHAYYRWHGSHYMYPWGPWGYTRHYPTYTYYPSYTYRDRQRTPRTFGTTRGYTRDGTYRLPSAGRTAGERSSVSGRRDTEGRTGTDVRGTPRTGRGDARGTDTRVRSRDTRSGRDGTVRQPTRTRTPDRVREGTQREGTTRDSGRSRGSQQEGTRSRDDRSRGDQSSGSTVRERSNDRSSAPAPRVRSQNTETRTQSTPPARVRSQGSQTRTRVQSTPSRDRRESVQSRPAPRRDSGSSVRRSGSPPQRSVGSSPSRSRSSSGTVRSGSSSSRSSGSRDSGSSRGGRQR